MIRLQSFADRALTYSTVFMVAVCIAAYFSAGYVIAQHARDFCFALADCPKV